MGSMACPGNASKTQKGGPENKTQGTSVGGGARADKILRIIFQEFRLNRRCLKFNSNTAFNFNPQAK